MITIKELKQLTQENKREKVKKVPLLLTGYLWHRNLSVYITYGLLRVFPSIRPNAVSLSMLLLGILGAFLLAGADLCTQSWGVALVYLSFLLDKVDGEIARYQHANSLRGIYLDEWYHDLVPAIVITAFFIEATYSAGIQMTLLLVAAVFLTLFRRYERKWYIIMAWKRGAMVRAGKMMPPVRSRIIDFLTQNILVKCFSAVERFDLLLLATAIVIGLKAYAEIDLSVVFLMLYTTASFLHTMRFALYNYFGGYDDKVQSLLTE